MKKVIPLLNSATIPPTSLTSSLLMNVTGAEQVTKAPGGVFWNTSSQQYSSDLLLLLNVPTTPTHTPILANQSTPTPSETALMTGFLPLLKSGKLKLT